MAQQESNNSLFMFNPWAVNPAAAGYRDIPTVLMQHRSQWLGFAGAPTNQYLNINAPILSKRLGGSLTFSNRRAGHLEAQMVIGAISYSVVKAGDFAIRIGLQGSLKRHTLRFFEADNLVAQYGSDRSVPWQRSTRYYGNFGMGTFVHYGESYLGFSVPFYLANIIGVNPFSQQTAAEQPHYYVMGGAAFLLSDGIVVKPQGQFRYTKAAPWTFDANLSAVFQDKVHIGWSYRAGKTNWRAGGESIAAIIIMQTSPKLAIGGSYDWILAPIGQFTYGSFEVMIRYDLKKKEVVLSNPRGF